MDVYYHLKAKVDFLRNYKTSLVGDLLDIGCGRMPYRSFIKRESSISSYTGVDIENDIYQNDSRPDFFWDGKKLPFEDEKYNTGLLIEVLEHVPDPGSVLKEIHRVLKPGGKLFITIPFIWNLHDVPYDEYRYTPFSIQRICTEAGFKVSYIDALGTWHSSLATILACYIRRGPIPYRIKGILSKLFLPVVSYLFKKDQNNPRAATFYEGQMITGIKMICEKV